MQELKSKLALYARTDSQCSAGQRINGLALMAAVSLAFLEIYSQVHQCCPTKAPTYPNSSVESDLVTV